MSAIEPGETHRPGIRWWPAFVVVGLAALAIGHVWLGPPVAGWDPAGMRQNQNLLTAAIVLVLLALLALWLLLASRAPWRWRVGIVGGGAALGAAAFALVEIRGVSGDLVPTFAWRWSERDEEAAARADPALSGGGGSGGGEATEGVVTPSAPTAPRSPEHDFPQFLGPDRSGVVRGPRLARDWTERPPRLLWRRPLGPGWSSFAVVGDRAVTQVQSGEEEIVLCLDVRTGKTVWSRAHRARFDEVIAGIGPRATPTVTDGEVYAVGATGVLERLDLATGAVAWSRRLVEELGADEPKWGRSTSPLVLGDRVILNLGGTQVVEGAERPRGLVALDRATGELLWASGTDRAGYSSPSLQTLLGTRQVLVLNKSSVSSHDPESGAILWQEEWPGRYPNVAQPVPVDDRHVLVSSGYGVGAKLFELTRDPEGTWSSRTVWSSRQLKAKFSNFVLKGGDVYGLDDGILVCLDPRTGRRRWKGGRYGHGQMLLVGDLLLVTAEAGDLVLVDPSPEELRELARIPALGRRTWASPALSGSRLLVRSVSEAACWELPVAREG